VAAAARRSTTTTTTTRPSLVEGNLCGGRQKAETPQVQSVGEKNDGNWRNDKNDPTYQYDFKYVILIEIVEMF
jgi:hypothetical protein